MSVPTQQAPGGRSAQPPPTPGWRRAARTHETQRPARGGEGCGRGAATRRGRAARAEARGSGRASGSPPVRRGPTDAQVRWRQCRAGRKRAKVTSPRVLRGGFAFFQDSKPFSFFLIFIFFSFFFFRLLGPKAAEAAATRGGEIKEGIIKLIKQGDHWIDVALMKQPM